MVRSTEHENVSSCLIATLIAKQFTFLCISILVIFVGYKHSTRLSCACCVKETCPLHVRQQKRKSCMKTVTKLVDSVEQTPKKVMVQIKAPPEQNLAAASCVQLKQVQLLQGTQQPYSCSMRNQPIAPYMYQSFHE